MKFEEVEDPKAWAPGVKAKHVVVTSDCRELRGDPGARAEAIRRISYELELLLKSWHPALHATFHLVLTVDRRGRKGLSSIPLEEFFKIPPETLV
jgi:hypothetical protein